MALLRESSSYLGMKAHIVPLLAKLDLVVRDKGHRLKGIHPFPSQEQ